jgi:hypothetical protein
MRKLQNHEDLINFSRLVCFVMAIFSSHDFVLSYSDADRIDMSLGKNVDKNNPVVKWVKMLLEKYDVSDLVDEHIVGEDPPMNDAECQRRLRKFFEAFEEKTGYTAEQAIRDIRGFMN